MNSLFANGFRQDCPMIILGLNRFHGESSAAIVRDGALVAAAERSACVASSTGQGFRRRQSHTAWVLDTSFSENQPVVCEPRQAVMGKRFCIARMRSGLFCDWRTAARRIVSASSLETGGSGIRADRG